MIFIYYTFSVSSISPSRSLSLCIIPSSLPHRPSLLPSRRDERRRLKWLQSMVISGCRCFSEGSASEFYYWVSEWVRLVVWGYNCSLLPSPLPPSMTEMRSRHPVVADYLQSKQWKYYFLFCFDLLGWFSWQKKTTKKHFLPQNKINKYIKYIQI